MPSQTLCPALLARRALCAGAAGAWAAPSGASGADLRCPLSLGCRLILLEIQDTLRQPPSAQSQMKRTVNVAITGSFCFYIGVAVLGYAANGNGESRACSPRCPPPRFPEAAVENHGRREWAAISAADSSLGGARCRLALRAAAPGTARD